MKLLFITQKIHAEDNDLAFTIGWVKEFIRQGCAVEVITLERGVFDDSFSVHSLGKEKGTGKLIRILTFLKLIFTLKYDRVFVHMNPEYVTLGGWWWVLTRRPIYLWYTHYKMFIHLRITGWLATRMFAATPQSLPQYEGNPKKVIPGHGIDISYWDNAEEPNVPDEKSLVYINRLSRSKRIEIAIKTLGFLDDSYTLTVYGRIVPGEEAYYEELQNLASHEPYKGRVIFAGSVPMPQLKKIFPKHRLMINMAMETIDKVMLECMLYGVYPVTDSRNSKAIGLPVYPKGERPEDIAEFIKGRSWEPYGKAELGALVREKHGIEALVSKMLAYIEPGK